MTIIPDQILIKMQRYCAEQERCVTDVRNKLNKLPLPSSVRDAIIQSLVHDQYIDEDRYTSLFIRSKMATHQWGRLRLRQELYQKHIDRDIIDRHLRAIDLDDYTEMMRTALDKWLRINPSNSNNKPKIFAFLLSKGYTTDEIDQITQ